MRIYLSEIAGVFRALSLHLQCGSYRVGIRCSSISRAHGRRNDSAARSAKAASRARLGLLERLCTLPGGGWVAGRGLASKGGAYDKSQIGLCNTVCKL